MPKIARVFPQGKFYLKNVLDSSGKAIIYLRYSVLNKEVRRSTGIKVTPELWDNTNQRVSGNSLQVRRLNSMLTKIKFEFDNGIRNYSKNITPEVVEAVLNKEEPVEKEKVFDIESEILSKEEFKLKSHKIKKSTFDLNVFGYRRIFSAMKKILGIEVVTPGHYNAKNVILAFDSLDSIMPPNKIQANYINKFLYENELISIKEYKYTEQVIKNYPIKYKRQKIENERMYLTLDEVEVIRSLYEKETARNRKVILAMLLFSFCSSGLRISDILTLKWEHIVREDGHFVIRKNQFKTNGRTNAIVNDYGMKILEDMKSLNKNQNHVFMPDSKMASDKSMKSAYYRSNRHLMALQKELEPLLGVKVRFHKMRHSFAVAAINSDANIHTIAKLLGHRSAITTESFYTEMLNKKVSQEFDEKISKAVKL